MYKRQEIAQRLNEIKPLRAVCGNCDGGDLRIMYPEKLCWNCEGAEVLMKHIGGYPGNYDRSIREQIMRRPPKLFKMCIRDRTSIERYKEQIDNVRNNREYDTLSKEIEFQSLEIELSQKKIGQANAKVAELKEDIVKNSAQIEELEDNLNHKKSELDGIVAETKAQEDDLRTKALDVEETIEPRLLNAFKRIRKNSRNGLGIVYVQRDSCGGCFNKVPPQRQIDIRMRKKVIVCEYCGRILIDPELAGVEAVSYTHLPSSWRWCSASMSLKISGSLFIFCIVVLLFLMFLL